MGGNVNWRWNGFHVGATATYTAYGADLKPDKSALYRQYYPEGNDFWNVSVDYGFQRARVAFAGETATGGCGAFATINTHTVVESLGDGAVSFLWQGILCYAQPQFQRGWKGAE